MTEQQIVRTFDDGFEIYVSLKRGTGTRDQDTLSATVHGETLEKARERADTAVSHLEKLANRTRKIQPETPGDDE